jgi:hypothetical protein
MIRELSEMRVIHIRVSACACVAHSRTLNLVRELLFLVSDNIRASISFIMVRAFSVRVYAYLLPVVWVKRRAYCASDCAFVAGV